ncbi:unnamed protein product [Thlaspi arvense]|uniref:Peptidase C1A papain C-terminal domain-containing protein n=1 Tax=Thlaspi arvense TaxID=13288 RepID=A0AAU9SY29_THLAR|nr:unnamed protein product [Thlaspi arvense]
MDRLKLSFSVFVLLFLFVSVSSRGILPETSSSDGGDHVIRQVVDGAEPKVLSSEDHFSLFKRKFGKASEASPEDGFVARHGVTQFSDLTRSEFRKKHLGVKGGFKLPKDANKAPILPTENLLERSWRSYSHQESGGVSAPPELWWVLTSSQPANSSALFNGSSSTVITRFDFCDPEEAGSCDSGCNGGLMNSAFEYTLKTGGLMREEDYPYTGKDGPTCKLDKSKIVASVSNFSVISIDEEQIAANLVKNGPLAVAINAAYMQTYIGGVSCPYICARRLNHGVLLVGYGSAGYAPARFKEKPYWIIKNSWGETWGENGFYKICKGRNICGVDSLVSTVSATVSTAAP